jgi:hypothetical protein
MRQTLARTEQPYRWHSLTELTCRFSADPTTHSFYAGDAGGWWRDITTRRHGQIIAQTDVGLQYGIDVTIDRYLLC